MSRKKTMTPKIGRHPTLVVTMGDPVGIGPEIIVKAMARNRFHRFCSPVVVGDPFRLESAMQLLKISLKIRVIQAPGEKPAGDLCIPVIPASRLNSKRIRWGKPTRATAAAAVRYITVAVDLVQAGKAAGLVTCPIHKSALRRAGYAHAGHTELIAEKTGVSDVVMMMAGSRLKVALVTRHAPLREIPSRLSTEIVFRTIVLTAEGLRARFGIDAPSIALSGLNPHAGEDGRFGDEEKKVLLPAVRRALKKGYQVEGPFPPDTVFYRALQGAFHAVIALYHDQGLIPFKLVHFTDGVNTTLGLPWIRTSVDHGTAYDIAGTGIADPGSLSAAIRMAADQVLQRRRSLPPKSPVSH